jgi:hypothetical protein
MKLLTLFAMVVSAAFGQSFQSELDGPLWKEKSGELRFTDEAVEFLPKGEDDARRWSFEDIQLFDLVSRTELRLLTYKDSKWKLGRDRELRFQLLSGEINDALFDRIQAKLTRPANDRVIEDSAEPRQRLAVKHLHPIGGCEGEILFYDQHIVYDSRQDGHDRDWRFGDAVEGVWSSDRYELELQVREPEAGHPGEFKTWRYQLKAPLDASLYEELKRRVYGLESH